MSDLNNLLDALIACKPNVPGPEWFTLEDFLAGASKRGEKIGRHSMQQRLTAFLKAGKIEQLRAPRRGSGTGWQFYYRPKNGKS